MPAVNEETGNRPKTEGTRAQIYDFVFESDTPMSKNFDIVLIISILLSVIVVMLDSVSTIEAVHGQLLFNLEWFFTILFTIEYLLRIGCVENRSKYAFSLFGIVDFLAIIPSYVSLFLPGSQFLLTIRILRVLRIFRILKLVKYVSEAELLLKALQSSRQKITVFLFSVLTLVVILGSLMYLIEGEDNGFVSIPHSIYWAIVTLTTVGFGDIVPQTALGRTLASFVMILGYSIIAVPTGIVTVEAGFASMEARKRKYQCQCHGCGNPENDENAIFCKICGEKLYDNRY